MRAGDIEGVGDDVIILAVRCQLPIAERDIVKFITATAMAVGRDGSGKTSIKDIQRVDVDIIYGKMDIHIGI